MAPTTARVDAAQSTDGETDCERNSGVRKYFRACPWGACEASALTRNRPELRSGDLPQLCPLWVESRR